MEEKASYRDSIEDDSDDDVYGGSGFIQEEKVSGLHVLGGDCDKGRRRNRRNNSESGSHNRWSPVSSSGGGDGGNFAWSSMSNGESVPLPSANFGERRMRVRPRQKDLEKQRGRRDKQKPWQDEKTIVQKVLPHTREAEKNKKSMFEEHIYGSNEGALSSLGATSPPPTDQSELFTDLEEDNNALQRVLYRSTIETSYPEAPWARYKTEEEEEDEDLAIAIANSLRVQ